MRHRQLHGITLLEVVAGVALLSLLAVTVMTTLRMATAQLGAEDAAAEIDQLSRIARTAIDHAQSQADGDEEEISSYLERTSKLAIQLINGAPAGADSATGRVIEVEYAGHRYSWLILETERLGVSTYLGREEGW
jgi:type II secretory pathway pseudopilin PulG